MTWRVSLATLPGDSSTGDKSKSRSATRAGLKRRLSRALLTAERCRVPGRANKAGNPVKLIRTGIGTCERGIPVQTYPELLAATKAC